MRKHIPIIGNSINGERAYCPYAWVLKSIMWLEGKPWDADDFSCTKVPVPLECSNCYFSRKYSP